MESFDGKSTGFLFFGGGFAKARGCDGLGEAVEEDFLGAEETRH